MKIAAPDERARRIERARARYRLVSDTSYTLRQLQQKSTLDKEDRLALAAADVLLLRLNKDLSEHD